MPRAKFSQRTLDRIGIVLSPVYFGAAHLDRESKELRHATDVAPAEIFRWAEFGLAVTFAALLLKATPP
jgi:hypothetical protein